MWSKEHQAAAYLSRVIEGPSKALQHHLSAGIELEKIAHGVFHREPWIGKKLLSESESRYQHSAAKEALAQAAHLGFRIICATDTEWPQEQFQQAFGFASSGRSDIIRSYQHDATCPHALWVAGDEVAESSQRAIAVVGTRALSNYGRHATEKLVSELVPHQWNIVSGGALGVDTVAHEQALASGGRTIIVMASGAGVNYPAANKQLFRRVAQGGGTLLTEYPPLLRPARHRFLTRNRLVAALSQGTVVVEAAWRSGALNTLMWAQGLGRVGMAVPGPITSINSLGCHDKIQKGEAQLVISGDDIRSLVEQVGAVDATEQWERQFAADDIQGLAPVELRVFDALSNYHRIETENIARDSGVPLRLCVYTLMALQERGLCQRKGTTWIRC
ncbi:DNA-protecting protein DprA [Corynebacterium sp. 3HC-13]|uniref:DNA-processing protein DprA n=1 Tax=Corynebacterium poyangense TaxID=2684405 RepID=UPI001CCEBFB5|nr:DNA-processing protein DprA [Corynebacterium poyangense]MBZ8178051.1 DNA-protecting protein DprA [Corynebacterium poyangense]